jgi:RNA polymerase sigma-70 factor (ECF subfamily)
MRIAGTLSIPFIARPVGAVRSELDQARLRRAFDANYTGVWRFLRRLGVAPDRVDDAAQQVFLIALEAMERIHEGSERAYLYATAVRVAHGIRRKIQRELASPELDADASPLPSPAQLTDQKRAREALDAIIARLDEDQRTVFVLAELEDFTTPEIATLLDVPLGTAASRLRRAREKFQSLVRRAYGNAHGDSHGGAS